MRKAFLLSILGFIFAVNAYAGNVFSVTNTDTGDRFTVMDNGNVGISHTAPNAPLTITSGGNDYSTNFAVRVENFIPRDIFCLLDNGNVGIGITLPSQKLEIIGNILASGTIAGNILTGTGTQLTALNGTQVTSGTVPIASVAIIPLETHTSGTLPDAALSTAVSLLGSDIDLASEVSGTLPIANLGISVTLPATTGATGQILKLTDETTLDWAAESGGSSQWITGEDSDIYYNLGYVGIGTTNPTEALEITGKLVFTDTNDSTVREIGIKSQASPDSNGNPLYIRGGTATGTGNGGNLKISGGDSLKQKGGSVTIEGGKDAAAPINGAVRISGGNAVESSNFNGGEVFISGGIADGTGVSGVVIIESYTGIGTTAPSANLQVIGSMKIGTTGAQSVLCITTDGSIGTCDTVGVCTTCTPFS